MFEEAVELDYWIRETLEEKLECMYVEVTDLKGTGDHFSAVVVSDLFEGKTPVEQHQMVYGALGDAMKSRIHALTLDTMTVEEWDRKAGIHR